jgi:hypothetical protein
VNGAWINLGVLFDRLLERSQRFVRGVEGLVAKFLRPFERRVAEIQVIAAQVRLAPRVLGALNVLRASSAARVVSAAALMAASGIGLFGIERLGADGACATSTSPYHPNAMMRTAAVQRNRLRMRSLLVLFARYSMRV